MTEKFTIPTDVEQSVHIRPTGNPTTDVANLNAAIAHIHGNPCGTIVLVETGFTLAINANIEFTQAIAPYTSASLIGSNRSTITLMNDASLTWGRYIDPPTHATIAVPAGITDEASRITTPGGLSPVIDDVLLMLANDSLNAKVQPHTAGGFTRPAEIFRVVDVFGGFTYFDTRAIDTMSDTPRIIKLPLTRKVRIENFELLGGTAVGAGAINCYCCADLTIANVKNFGAGQISINYCHNTRIIDCNIIRVQTSAETYGISLGVNSIALIDRCIFGYAKHCVTTGGFADTPNSIRYGAGKGYIVSNCTAGGLGHGLATSVPAFDTHSETYGMIYDNCQVFGGKTNDTPLTYAFSMRGRRSIIRNCYMRPDLGGYGAQIVAPDCVFENNHVDAGWAGVLVNSQHPTPELTTDRVTIKGNTFFNQFATGVWIFGGKGHQIIGNQTPKAGSGGGGTLDTKISFGVDGGHVLGGPAVADRISIRDNSLDLDGGNVWSIDNHTRPVAELLIYGNQMRGYGATSIGVKNDLANNNTAYAAKNYTD